MAGEVLGTRRLARQDRATVPVRAKLAFLARRLQAGTLRETSRHASTLDARGTRFAGHPGAGIGDGHAGHPTGFPFGANGSLTGILNAKVVDAHLPWSAFLDLVVRQIDHVRVLPVSGAQPAITIAIANQAVTASCDQQR